MPRRTKPWVIEPTWYLRSIAYSEYMSTGHWHARRQAFKQDRFDKGLERVCDLCGPWFDLGPELNDEIPKWHVHHRTYLFLGAERDEHLSYLCGPCHHLVHFPDAQQSKYWAMSREFIADPADFRTEWDKELVEDDGIPF